MSKKPSKQNVISIIILAAVVLAGVLLFLVPFKSRASFRAREIMDKYSLYGKVVISDKQSYKDIGLDYEYYNVVFEMEKLKYMTLPHLYEFVYDAETAFTDFNEGSLIFVTVVSDGKTYTTKEGVLYEDGKRKYGISSATTPSKPKETTRATTEATQPTTRPQTQHSTKHTTSDPYHVNDYDHPEDFYYWNLDDFYDYEEAEEYFNEHHE